MSRRSVFAFATFLLTLLAAKEATVTLEISGMT